MPTGIQNGTVYKNSRNKAVKNCSTSAEIHFLTSKVITRFELWQEEINEMGRFLTFLYNSQLTHKLAGYFAIHIEARGGSLKCPPKIFEMANN